MQDATHGPFRVKESASKRATTSGSTVILAKYCPDYKQSFHFSRIEARARFKTGAAQKLQPQNIEICGEFNVVANYSHYIMLHSEIWMSCMRKWHPTWLTQAENGAKIISMVLRKCGSTLMYHLQHPFTSWKWIGKKTGATIIAT